MVKFESHQYAGLQEPGKEIKRHKNKEEQTAHIYPFMTPASFRSLGNKAFSEAELGVYKDWYEALPGRFKGPDVTITERLADDGASIEGIFLQSPGNKELFEVEDLTAAHIIMQSLHLPKSGFSEDRKSVV